MKKQLHDCKELVLKLLEQLEITLKGIKDLNRVLECKLDTSDLEQKIVDLYEIIEESRYDIN